MQGFIYCLGIVAGFFVYRHLGLLLCNIIIVKKIYVKNKAPFLVRLYNLLLLFCNKVHLIDYKIDHKKYLDKLTKEHNIGFETNEISKNALNRFISNVNQNPINPATQLFINKELNRTFFNRKKIDEYINKYPDTKNIDVSRPIFIVGLPRTGTTALQNMFSVLDDCRVLNLWELHYPTSYSEGVKAINNAKIQTKKYAFLQNFSKPEQKYIHPVGVDYPDECFRLLFNSFTSIAISSALGLDEYENWILKSDMSNTYKEYKIQLQILSQSNPTKQLVLKAPEHLWNLDELLKVFPSARIIMTHRDPLNSIVSYASMISMFRRTTYSNSNFKRLGPYVTDTFENALNKAYTIREKLNSNNIIDIHCNDIHNKPLETFSRVCKVLRININNNDINDLKYWVEKDNLDAPGSHTYTHEKYGVNRELVEKKFQFYDHLQYLMN